MSEAERIMSLLSDNEKVGKDTHEELYSGEISVDVKLLRDAKTGLFEALDYAKTITKAHGTKGIYGAIRIEFLEKIAYELHYLIRRS